MRGAKFRKPLFTDENEDEKALRPMRIAWVVALIPE